MLKSQFLSTICIILIQRPILKFLNKNKSLTTIHYFNSTHNKYIFLLTNSF